MLRLRYSIPGLVVIVLASQLGLVPNASAQSRSPKCSAELGLGIAHAKAGDRVLARTNLEQAYALCRIPITLFNIGMTYREDKQTDEAIRYLPQFLKEAALENPMRAVAQKVINELSPKQSGNADSGTNINRIQDVADGINFEDGYIASSSLRPKPEAPLGN